MVILAMSRLLLYGDIQHRLHFVNIDFGLGCFVLDQSLLYKKGWISSGIL
jgi:hypothetical protein